MVAIANGEGAAGLELQASEGVQSRYAERAVARRNSEVSLCDEIVRIVLAEPGLRASQIRHRLPTTAQAIVYRLIRSLVERGQLRADGTTSHRRYFASATDTNVSERYRQENILTQNGDPLAELLRRLVGEAITVGTTGGELHGVITRPTDIQPHCFYLSLAREHDVFRMFVQHDAVAWVRFREEREYDARGGANGVHE